MISLSGLAQTYPGYAAQEDQTAKTAKTHEETQIAATKARDAAIKSIGQTVAGAALAGNGPQAPAPGQPSVPAAPPPGPPTAQPPQGAPPVPQGSPPPMSQGAPPQPPAGPPPVAGGAPVSFKMGLQPAIAQILKTTPNVANHPEILLSALNHFKDLGVLDPDAEAKVDEAASQHTLQRVAAARGHLKAVQAGGGQPAEPEAPEPPAAAALPTATDPKTGAKVQWDGKAWQPIT